jgi:hypothetical protein
MQIHATKCTYLQIGAPRHADHERSKGEELKRYFLFCIAEILPPSGRQNDGCGVKKTSAEAGLLVLYALLYPLFPE